MFSQVHSQAGKDPAEICRRHRSGTTFKSYHLWIIQRSATAAVFAGGAIDIEANAMTKNASGAMSKSKTRGFTLIELMITVAIVAILASVAYPSYQEYIRKGRRAAAQAEMLDIANRQQQYLLINRGYASKTALENGGYALSTDVANYYGYAITVGSGTVPTYSLTFTPSGAQATDGDLVLNSDGLKTRAGVASKW